MMMVVGLDFFLSGVKHELVRGRINPSIGITSSALNKVRVRGGRSRFAFAELID